MNDNLFAQFARHSGPCVVAQDGTTWTYADLAARTAELAAGLARLGLAPGDRVTVQVPKSVEALWLYLACLRGGFVFHPLNDAYRRDEVAFLLGDAEPALAVCAPEREAEFREGVPKGCEVRTLDAQGKGTLNGIGAGAPPAGVAQRSAGDVAVLLYTSGTTGRPKGAMITHGNLASNAQALVSAWGFSAADRLLHALPLYHAHGLFVGLGCTFTSGASLTLLPQFDAREVVARLRDCTVMMGVPTHYVRLLAEPSLDRRSCAGVRLFVSGSAPLQPEVFRGFRERTGHEILERYGMTETGMNTSNPLEGERRPGTVGRPLPGVRVRIAGGGGIGEIELAGPNVFSGYWRLPDKTAESFTPDGWFRTGDQGRIDADGYLTIVGRSKDLVISGGLNVYPREVEIALDRYAGVAESAVIGAPHPDFGEGVVAVVVPDPGARLTETDIIAFMKERLAAFKVPKRVLIVSELPRNSMGKVEKQALRERYSGVFA